MALSEFEIKRTEMLVESFIEKRRPSPEIRDKVDLNYRFIDQTVEIIEIRPVWDNPSKFIEQIIAKATYVKSKKFWKIYWQRGNLKWVSYEPNPSVRDISDFLKIVDNDEYHCFWG